MPRKKTPSTTYGKTRTQEVAQRQKQAQALQLRMAGATLKTIADQLGYASPSGAHYAITKAVEELSIEPAKELVALELSRLDQMQIQCWRNLMAGDTSEVGNILRIQDQRAKYTGLDKHFGGQIVQQTTINVGGQHITADNIGKKGVLVIQGNEDEYIAALAHATGIKDMPNLEFKEIAEYVEAQPQYTDEAMVIEGEVVENGQQPDTGNESSDPDPEEQSGIFRTD